jgi:GST-like protein
MLTLHTWATQNARKISVMLEECGLEYRIVPVDIMNGEQFAEPFKRLNPNCKIPVLVDSDLCSPSGEPVAIFETGAILLHLAEKTGRFLSRHPAERARTISWLFWQTSAVGPVFGNFSHFASAMAKDRSRLNAYLAKTGAPEPVHYAIERFARESFRLLGVLNQALAEREFIAGELSIADFATYPWVESAWTGFALLNPNLSSDCHHVERWMATLAEREALRRGMARLAWGAKL